MARPAPVGERGRRRQEHEIASRHESGGQATGAHLDGNCIGEGTPANLLENVEKQHIILS